jgi:hypothetical protein
VSARMFYLPRPTLPEPSEILASLVCWGAYILLLSCYCSLYQVLVDASQPDFVGSFLVVCRNWGVWLLTTPLVFQAWRRYSGRHGEELTGHLRFVAIVLAISVAVPVTIDLHTQERSIVTSLMIFLPRYLATMLIVYMIWHTFVRRHFPPAQSAAMDATLPQAPEQVNEEPPRPAITTLLVSKGADECLIQLDSIESLSAAGNYVEIVANGQCYLLRAPLKQVEDLLPPEKFLRIHRSHIVKREVIARIKTQPSGNGTVHLHNGRALPMSKKHKSELQRFRVAFDRPEETLRDL